MTRPGLPELDHSPPKPWLSVVTVVREDSAGLERTWTSLREQATEGLEWIVVDSSVLDDGVAQQIQRIHASHPTIAIIYDWQTPSGIFPAMNRGIALSTGRYTFFLNSGDTLVSPSVLARAKEVLQVSNWPECAYANVEMVNDQGRSYTPPTWNFSTEKRRSFARGYFPCHQGTIARCSVLRSLGGFDSTYSIAGDYDLFLRLQRHYTPLEIHFTLARFAPGGASTADWWIGLREFHQARRRSLQPRGFSYLMELIDTVWVGTKTVLYRMLWAPRRPLHTIVRRFTQ